MWRIKKHAVDINVNTNTLHSRDAPRLHRLADRRGDVRARVAEHRAGLARRSQDELPPPGRLLQLHHLHPPAPEAGPPASAAAGRVGKLAVRARCLRCAAHTDVRWTGQSI